MRILEDFEFPQDLIKIKDLDLLASELRRKIIEVVDSNGGHLASNLGVVELTIAVLSVFGKKEDSIVWDVGHQCYAYKMLTGRLNKINSLRKNGGISGFTCRGESPYDKFTSGHSSNAISEALGLAQAGWVLGKKGKTIAIVGDGAITGGLAYEGFNNAGKFGKNLIIILNDNEMSISQNVGAIAKYLTKLRTRPVYLETKRIANGILGNFKFLGQRFKDLLLKSRLILKNVLMSGGTIFESLGLSYYGPINGHDIFELIRTFSIVKNIEKPILIHVITKKGHGFVPAEKKPDKFHAVAKLNVEKENLKILSRTFSDVFGEFILKTSEKNNKIFAITAAMSGAVGLADFEKKFPSRFADVGIAETHATTFSAGLAAGGMIPVFAVYSTFLQRAFDQIIHDVAMQRLKVIFAVDRAGLVGEDGESHQGIFDVPFLRTVPNIEVYSPSFFNELEISLEKAIESDICTVVRYPKGKEFFKPDWLSEDFNDFEIYGKNNKILIVTYGRIFSFAAQFFDKFSNKLSILKLNKISPINQNAIKLSLEFKNIFFFEESIKSGGIGEVFLYNLNIFGFKGSFDIIAIENFVKHATVAEQLSMLSLDLDGMIKKVKKII
ncbi:MAG: 1-deoxy-D-xylulose-5-phosphate synthase [Oscillospiraceae bacterium]|jgi:1-deoxy-D-xylulose-5-phosphate synthase|nr:1-deoxy-D-xylulose-5-phosphate synthase [Oscillospiraceae bacterium]